MPVYGLHAFYPSAQQVWEKTGTRFLPSHRGSRESPPLVISDMLSGFASAFHSRAGGKILYMHPLLWPESILSTGDVVISLLLPSQALDVWGLSTDLLLVQKTFLFPGLYRRSITSFAMLSCKRALLKRVLLQVSNFVAVKSRRLCSLIIGLFPGTGCCQASATTSLNSGIVQKSSNLRACLVPFSSQPGQL